MFGLGLPELMIIVLLILLFFGAKRLPGIGTGLGKTVKEVRNIKKELTKNKESEQKTPTEDAPAEKKSLESKLAQSVQDKLSDKVIDRVPGVRQAKIIKHKAEKIKRIVT